MDDRNALAHPLLSFKLMRNLLFLTLIIILHRLTHSASLDNV